MSTINLFAHGLTAGQRVVLSNIVPSVGTGVDPDFVYYVLAAGLSANAFQISETDGGTPLTILTPITAADLQVVPETTDTDAFSPAYRDVTNPADVHAPPEVPPTPPAPVVGSAVVASTSGSFVELRIAQASALNLRQNAIGSASGFSATATPASTALAGNLLIGTASSRETNGGFTWPAGWLPIEEAQGVEFTDPNGDHVMEVRYKVAVGTETNLVVSAVISVDMTVTLFEFNTGGYEWEPVLAGNANTTVASNPNVWPSVTKPDSKGVEVLHFAARTSEAFGDNVLPAAFTTTYDTVPVADRIFVGYRLIAENATPYNYTNPDTFAKKGSYVIVAFAKVVSDPTLTMEVQITREFSGGSPVWTDANIAALPAGHRNFAYKALGSTDYAVRLRRTDVYGKFSAWSTHATHTTAAGSDSATASAHAAASDPHTQYRLEADNHTHASSGLQGGTIDHASLTNVTANQHHNRDHAATHGPAAADPLKLDDLAAPDDNTDLNVSTTAHGLAPKITGADGDVLTKSGAAAVWATPPAGGGGAPSTADYLVGTAQGGLSAEIVVGTTPGGELGGTWASPTVDATHSGSAHVLLTANAPAAVGTAAAVGTGTASAKDDHVHAHEAAHIAHDTIWDAAGDLAVGSGADTAAKLAKGNAGATLAMLNGAVTWNASAAFPGSPATNDRYYRTDLGEEFMFDGTRWRCTVNHALFIPQTDNIAATQTDVVRVRVPWLAGGSDIWLKSAVHAFNVSAGTALGASHSWVSVIKKLAVTTGTLTTIATFTVNSGASATWRESTPVAINALLNAGTTHVIFTATHTKTGTPGNLFAYLALTYNHVAT